MTINLVPFGAEHLARTRSWFESPAVMRPLLPGGVTASNQGQWFDWMVSDRSQRVFAIMDTEMGHVGNLGFKNIDGQPGRAELWNYIGQPSAGCGLGTAAVSRALKIGFEQMALGKVYLHVDPGDIAALRIYADNGFQREVALRDQLASAGERSDPTCMSVLDREWRASQGLGPRVVLMQPQFLPWLGYLELIHRADVFVFLDDFQFLRRSWGHRNQLFVVRGKVGMVTLPVRHASSQETTFQDVAEAETTAWRRKLLTQLRQNYARAPYGEAVLALIHGWFASTYRNVADLEIAFIEKVAAYLDLRPHFVRSSSLNIAALRRSWRLRALLEKLGAGVYVSPHGSFRYMKEDGVFPLPELPVYFQDHIPQPYRQHGSDEFIPRLSCLDAMANLDAAEMRAILQGTAWWQNWEERALSEATTRQEDPSGE